MSNATTKGVRVSVDSLYLPHQSDAESGRFVFAYTVNVQNRRALPIQLITRHWIIGDNAGTLREVKGDGVVGKQPVLQPGESFQYTSGCVLETERGTMHGSYQIVTEDGDTFDAEVAPFELSIPGASAEALLN